MIGSECYDGKIVLVFDDYTVREINLSTMLETESVNLLSKINNQEYFEMPVDFAINKEMGTMALAAPSYVDFFDTTYNYFSRITIEGSIEKIVFCDLYIVL